MSPKLCNILNLFFHVRAMDTFTERVHKTNIHRHVISTAVHTEPRSNKAFSCLFCEASESRFSPLSWDILMLSGVLLSSQLTADQQCEVKIRPFKLPLTARWQGQRLNRSKEMSWNGGKSWPRKNCNHFLFFSLPFVPTSDILSTWTRNSGRALRIFTKNQPVAMFHGGMSNLFSGL